MRKRERLIVWISSLLLLLVSSSRAQDVSSNTPPGEYSYQNFSPSMAIIIVVLIAALFFMGFFSIYIRHCTDSSAIGSVRQLGASIRRRNAARGLDRAVLETFPTFLYSEVKDKKIGKGALECAVCLNEFDEDDTLRLIPRCDHVFHPDCIDAWLESHVTCPVCRANLAEPGEPTTDTHPVLEDIADPPNRTNDEVSIQITDEPERAETVTVPPQPMDRNPSVNRARPPRSRSVRPRVWPKFPRSHSTGHSLVQPGQNVDRFTLRLPDDLRKKVMSRALNRTTSCGVGLPREGSARRGYRTGFGEGSSRGGRSVRRFDTAAKSDRWVFTMAPPFFSRAASVRSPRTAANDGEGSTSAKMPGGRTAVRMPSFKCLEPKGDETGLVAAADPTRPPV